MYDLLLQNITRQIQLTPAEAAVLTAAFAVRTIRKRELILRAGEVCRYEHFVNRGVLRAFHTAPDGTEHTVQFALEDWWIGDLASFSRGTPAGLSIEALEDGELLVIDRAGLEALYGQVPTLERYFRVLLQNAFIGLQQRVLGALGQPAAERYAAFRARYPGLEQRVPQYLVAQYVGLTPPSLSRLRRQLARG